jgi:hypothetical protein
MRAARDGLGPGCIPGRTGAVQRPAVPGRGPGLTRRAVVHRPSVAATGPPGRWATVRVSSRPTSAGVEAPVWKKTAPPARTLVAATTSTQIALGGAKGPKARIETPGPWIARYLQGGSSGGRTVTLRPSRLDWGIPRGAVVT